MSDFHAFVEELFSGLGPVRFKRMFGVAALYADDLIFGLIDDDTIYLLADEAMRAEMEAQGSVRWVYRFSSKASGSMSYWRLPEAALDDPEEAAAWGRKALAVAQGKATGKRPKRKR
ncbi:MAG: TfoX/Sxy family protein [Phenylobacterium sp.]